MPDRSNGRLPVTLAIPVKNDARNLARCLDQLERFAETVVLDSGSTDETAAVAKAHGARLLQFAWDGKYPKKRNWFLLTHPPTTPWVLFLDADEYVGEEFCDALGAALGDTDKVGFWLNYTNHFLGRALKYGVAQRKLALFRVGAGLYEQVEEDRWSSLDMEVHEHPVVQGRIGEIGVPIEHQGYAGLESFVERHWQYALWEAQRFSQMQNGESKSKWPQLTFRQRFKYRNLKKWWYPWFYFMFTYFFKRGFLDGAPGFYHAMYKAWYFQTIRLILCERMDHRGRESNPGTN